MRSTADGNVAQGLEPLLSVTSGQPLFVEFTLTSLPSTGTLRLPQGSTPIAAGDLPLFLGRSGGLVYEAPAGFAGTTSFGFKVSDGIAVGFGTITVIVQIGTCLDNVIFCDDGR